MEITDNKVTFPSAIRIGYRTYRLEPWVPMQATARDAYGECDNCVAVIRVRADLDAVKIANTTIHEVLHACWWVSGLDDEDKQERIVTTLANQLTQVWRDNPDLVAWINARLKVETE